MMQGSSAVLSLIQAFVAASLIGGWSSIQLLAITQLLAGCVGALSSPSSQAATSQVVPPELLPRAVAIRRLVNNTAMVLGFGAAGSRVVVDVGVFVEV